MPRFHGTTAATLKAKPPVCLEIGFITNEQDLQKLLVKVFGRMGQALSVLF